MRPPRLTRLIYATEANWAIEADVAGEPTETDKAEANKANEAKANEADAKANETGGAIVADEIKANVIDKIVAADEAIVFDEVIADDKAILIDKLIASDMAIEADATNKAMS